MIKERKNKLKQLYKYSTANDPAPSQDLINKAREEGRRQGLKEVETVIKNHITPKLSKVDKKCKHLWTDLEGGIMATILHYITYSINAGESK